MGKARPTAAAFAAGLTAAVATAPALAQTADLVDRSALRVCADPANLPMSNDKGEGFENKLAELVGRSFGLPVVYTWFPQATGFVRQTLNARRCDLIMGFAQGDELVQNSNHYYRSAYVLIYKPGGELDGIETLADPRLKGKRIGVVAGTPPATILALNGMIGDAEPFALTVDRRHDSPADRMLARIAEGSLAAGLLWGPIAGPLVKAGGNRLAMVPLVKEGKGPRMVYRITLGLRPNEPEWKHKLNDFIKAHQGEINAILLEAGVPLLDEKDRPITR